MTDRELLTAAVSTAHRMNALQLGSPEAIADCQRRREDAQRIAQHAADANEGKDWNAESLQGEYDTDSEGDENDAN